MRRYVKYRNFEETSAFETSVSSNALTELLSDNLLKWLLWKKKNLYFARGEEFECSEGLFTRNDVLGTAAGLFFF